MDKGKLKEAAVHGTVEFPLAVYCQETDEEFFVKLHWHEETEIIYLKSGKFVIDINMVKYRVAGPALFFVGSGDIHSIYGESGCRENAVVFDMRMLSFEHFDSVQYQIIKPLLEKRMLMGLQISSEDRIWKEMERLYEAVFSEASQKRTTSGIRIKAYLYEILAVLYENGKFMNMEEQEVYQSEKVENIKKILGYIHENYKRQIRILELAQQLRMNEQYFSRYFKRIIGKTPMEYINEVRIEKAAEYLLQTDRKIIDIAMECGYENMGYFIKRFRLLKGIVPSEYRKSHNSVINSHNG